MELLTFTIGASESKRFEKAGRYLEIIDAAGPLNIDMNEASGNRADSMRNALSGFYSEEPFSAFEVTNPGPAQTVTLMITDRRGGSRRQPGTVSVIDGARARTLADVAFTAGGAQSGGADQTCHILLSNPANTGRRIVISQLGIYATASAGGLIVSIHQAQGPTLSGDALLRTGASKRQINGAAPLASVASARSLSSATALPGVTHTEIMTIYGTTVGVQREIENTEPIMLFPGSSMVIRASPRSVGASIEMAAWYDYTEELIV
ncbi:MAG: hypothetical protein ACOVPA_14580 [Rubrivivax sp.]